MTVDTVNPAPMPRICLLIPVYNQWDYTRRCIEDLKGKIPDDLSGFFRIVIIDSGSEDGTENWVRENHPDIKILKGNGSLYWTGAINMGLRFALEQLGSDYMLLWNNDVTAGMEYFRILFEWTGKGPQGITGSKVMTLMDRNIIWSFGGFFNPETGVKKAIANFRMDGSDFKSVRSVDWCTGMGTLIHCDTIRKIGYMDDKSFPHYFGDTDFTYRASVAGIPVRVHPRLVLYNDTSNTGLRPQNTLRSLFSSLVDIRSTLNIKMNYRFIRKHAHGWRAYFNLVSFYLRVFGGFFKWKILEMFEKQRETSRFFTRPS